MTLVALPDPTFAAVPGELLALAAACLLGAPLLLWLVVRPLGRWLLGPLFAWETVRIARQGRTIALRCGYALALLAALFVTFPDESEASHDDIAGFATRFSELFLLIQSAAAMILTPMYLGGAVSDEKEKRSLDFLLITPMSSREIVVGKYAARLLNLLGILLTGLPILALTQLWGGVDLVHVVVMFLAAMLGMASAGAMSLLCSVLFQKTITSVAISYLILAGVSTCLSPVAYSSSIAFQKGLQTELSRLETQSSEPGEIDAVHWQMLQIFSLPHLAVGGVCLLLALLYLRQRASPTPMIRVAAEVPEPPSLVVPGLAPDVALGRDPLLWKENRPPTGAPALLARTMADFFWLYFAGFVAVLVLATLVFQDIDVLRPVYWVLAGVCEISFCLMFMMRLSGCITRERELRTLESLVALPVDRSRILWAKLYGMFLRTTPSLISLLAMLFFGTVFRAFPPLTAALLLLLTISQAALVASISMLVSLNVGSTLRAHTMSLAIVLIVFLASLFLPDAARALHLLDTAGAKEPLIEQVLRAKNPYQAWRLAREPVDHGRAVLIAASTYVFAAGVLLAICLVQFRITERYE